MSEPAAPPRHPLAVSPARDRDAGRDDFYEHLVQVCLLLVAQDGPLSAGDLREGLRPLGFEQPTGAVEAALDVLAAEGLVHCTQAPSTDGGASRAYATTADGSSWLRAATAELRRTEIVLGGFLARCGERLLPQP